MKKVLYKKRHLREKRARIIDICEHSQDEECLTYIAKRFVYIIDPICSRQEEGRKPDIRIEKSYDTVRNIEYFDLHVKGVTQVKKGRETHRVDFAHSLRITVDWNTRFLSPEQSATVA